MNFKALNLFSLKIASGRYKDYTKEMLEALYKDCVNQVSLESNTEQICSFALERKTEEKCLSS